jgi:hypothetical protein
VDRENCAGAGALGAMLDVGRARGSERCTRRIISVVGWPAEYGAPSSPRSSRRFLNEDSARANAPGS